MPFVFRIALTVVAALTAAGAVATPVRLSTLGHPLYCEDLERVIEFTESHHLRFLHQSVPDVYSVEFFEAVSSDFERLLQESVSAHALGAESILGPARTWAEAFMRCREENLEARLSENQLTELSVQFLKAFLRTLDPHSDFISERELGIRLSLLEGHFVGVGVATENRGNYLEVIEVLKGSPAEASGMRVTDRILRIGTIAVRNQSDDEISYLIRGPRGSWVSFLIDRKGERLQIEMRRDVIVEPSVAGRVVNSSLGIGYIQISHFFRHTPQEFFSEWMRLNSVEPLKGLILDLRYNPGGMLDAARAVTELFLDSGPIVHVQGAVRETLTAERGYALIRVPLVVLVNERSASASEIVAGALRDHGRALLVGSATLGKSTVQSVYELPRELGMAYHGALKLTGFAFYLPNGELAGGIRPDLTVGALPVNVQAAPTPESLGVHPRIQTHFQTTHHPAFAALEHWAKAIRPKESDERPARNKRDRAMSAATAILKRSLAIHSTPRLPLPTTTRASRSISSSPQARR